MVMVVAVGISRWQRSKRQSIAKWAGLGVGAAALAAAVQARASVAIAVLFDELVSRSSTVAVATPVARESTWEDGRIVTYTRLHVDRVVEGTAPTEVEVRTLGGSVGRVGQIVEGEASFDLDRAAFAFLEPARGSAARPSSFAATARAQGVFALSSPGGVPRLAAPQQVRTDASPRAWVQGGALLVPPLVRDSGARLAARALGGLTIEEAAREVASAWPALHRR